MAMNYDAVNRPSSRVSRPPGGTSSNIFGTPDAVQASTRNANNSMKSSIFDSAPEPTKASPPSKRKNPASDASNDIFNVEEKENTAGTDGADVPTKETSNTFKSTLLASGESTMQPGSDPLDHKQRRSFTNSRNQSEIFEPLPERTIKSGPFANTFTSSVFGKSEADVPPPSTSTVQAPTVRNRSNVPMFAESNSTNLPNEKVRSPNHQLSSSLFNNLDYPDAPDEPLARRRPRTAYKSANGNTASTLLNYMSVEIPTDADEQRREQVARDAAANCTQTFKSSVLGSPAPDAYVARPVSSRGCNQQQGGNFIGSGCAMQMSAANEIFTSDGRCSQLRHRIAQDNRDNSSASNVFGSGCEDVPKIWTSNGEASPKRPNYRSRITDSNFF